ncbi:alpha-glucosidase [Arthrobacter sp. zg-Y916]|uniref:Alpha-glucosidase n=1 Tax=Arthrobacter caoxuetaonis TaxID=2886935 RepID=A0A9X1SB52_9MICC|nr:MULTISPECIES: alpha-glucosidase [Arthrobacter]MCC3296833.1 alpha-glucosidase [Arthrobacter caoxuetaonis]MCC9192909.1 alpha-glucosidase [Arthrobacter sp. zg-Y916]USQ56349.1 alpha-glucosidase [Arthrobacter caoxuetaonis]
MRDSSRPAWWTNAVVYQIYPRSFQDTTDDGIGDLTGIVQRLDHLSELGVDVIWLSPIHESPQHDNGYDISNYRRIDAVFGTEDEFDYLLAEVHARGMKMIMDLVVNHTSTEHEAFKVSASSRENISRDSYHWRDPRGSFKGGEPGAEPNNWGSLFGGSAWSWHELTQQYYLHIFSAHQPDLNWASTRVRTRVFEMMNWWMDRGIDGFRMDAINYISKDQRFPDSMIQFGGVWGDGAPFYTSGPRVHEFVHEMMRKVFADRDTDYLVVGETTGATVEEALLFTIPERGELDMLFQFEHVNLDHGPGGKWDRRPVQLRDLKTSWNRWQRGLEGRGWNSLYLSNHDQPRHVSRFGNDGDFRYESATLWATLLHMQRGTPFIYQGEEIGMVNADFSSIDQYRDVESLNFYAEATARGRSPQAVLELLRHVSRDNARTPMQWDAGPRAGFSGGIPWIGLGPRHREINVETDKASVKSIFRYYQELIRMRHELPVVALGTFNLLYANHPALFAFRRTLGEVSLSILANPSYQELPVPPDLRTGKVLLGNYGGEADPAVLAPWEARVTDISATG